MSLSKLAQAKPNNMSFQVKDLEIPDYNVTADEAKD